MQIGSAIISGAAPTAQGLIKWGSARSLSADSVGFRRIILQKAFVYSGVGTFTVMDRSLPKGRKGESVDASGALRRQSACSYRHQALASIHHWGYSDDMSRDKDTILRAARPEDPTALRAVLYDTFESTWRPNITRTAAEAYIQEDRPAVFRRGIRTPFWG